MILFNATGECLNLWIFQNQHNSTENVSILLYTSWAQAAAHLKEGYADWHGGKDMGSYKCCTYLDSSQQYDESTMASGNV